MKIIKADQQAIPVAVKILKRGGSVAYPTDTSYGLAVDATNDRAVRKLYRIKSRGFRRPVHVVVASLAVAKKIVRFNRPAELLFKRFLPGPLTLVLPLRSPPIYRPINGHTTGAFLRLSAGTGTLGIRVPKNNIALQLVRALKCPITATSANPAAKTHGGFDAYSATEVARQFKGKKYRPDLILDAGRLQRVKPSTLVALTSGRVTIIRPGPVTQPQIKKVLGRAYVDG